MGERFPVPRRCGSSPGCCPGSHRAPARAGASPAQRWVPRASTAYPLGVAIDQHLRRRHCQPGVACSLSMAIRAKIVMPLSNWPVTAAAGDAAAVSDRPISAIGFRSTVTTAFECKAVVSQREPGPRSLVKSAALCTSRLPRNGPTHEQACSTPVLRPPGAANSALVLARFGQHTAGNQSEIHSGDGMQCVVTVGSPRIAAQGFALSAKHRLRLLPCRAGCLSYMGCAGPRMAIRFRIQRWPVRSHSPDRRPVQHTHRTGTRMDGCQTAMLALVMHRDAKLHCRSEAHDPLMGVALIQDIVDHRGHVPGVVADTIESPQDRLAMHPPAHRPHLAMQAAQCRQHGIGRFSLVLHGWFLVPVTAQTRIGPRSQADRAIPTHCNQTAWRTIWKKRKAK